VNACVGTLPEFMSADDASGSSTRPPRLRPTLRDARLVTSSDEFRTVAASALIELLDDRFDDALVATVDVLVRGAAANVVTDTILLNTTRSLSAINHVRNVIAKWIDATAFSSSLDESRKDPNFATLKRLSWAAVPGLLECMATGTARLQCAELLAEITSSDPTTDADLGNARQIGDAWIHWGRSRGLL